MEIFIFGLSHKTAPVEIRERFCLPRESGPDLLQRALRIPGIREALVLSTCNRMEILWVAENGQGVAEIRDLLGGVSGLGEAELNSYLHLFRGEEAVRRLFRIAASLDSMVLGEPQILGQVKEAFQQAVAGKGSGLFLNKLFHRAFFVAKRVRTETKIGAQAVSVSYAAVELARKILGSLEDQRILLIGAGEMSELAARHFIGQGVREMLVTNRTYSRAVELAREFNAQAVPFEDFPGQLKSVDIVLSSTGSNRYIIRKEQLADVIRVRKNRPMFFIDIAVPRDVDPRVNEMDNIYVYDIDDLQGIVETNKEERKKEIDRAEAIVAEGVAGFQRWLDSLDVVPTILGMRSRLEEICRREVERTIAFRKNVSEEERKSLDLLTHSIINKILHHPIALLKHQNSHSHGKFYVEAARKMFNLDEDEP